MCCCGSSRLTSLPRTAPIVAATVRTSPAGESLAAVPLPGTPSMPCGLPADRWAVSPPHRRARRNAAARHGTLSQSRSWPTRRRPERGPRPREQRRQSAEPRRPGHTPDSPGGSPERPPLRTCNRGRPTTHSLINYRQPFKLRPDRAAPFSLLGPQKGSFGRWTGRLESLPADTERTETARCSNNVKSRCQFVIFEVLTGTLPLLPTGGTSPCSDLNRWATYVRPMRALPRERLLSSTPNLVDASRVHRSTGGPP